MRKEYVDFLDRFDGGGAGRTGNSFEGGGLLSALANIFATPYGSEDQARRAQRRQALGLLDTAAAPAQAKIQPGAPYKAPPYDPARMLEFNQPPARLPSHLTGPKMGMPPIPSHLTGPKMGTLPPAPPRPVQQPHQFTTHLPQTDLPAKVLLETPTAARHTPLSNLTDADYVAMAAENPAFEAWLIGQPNVLSLPDQAKRFLNLQLINQARQ